MKTASFLVVLLAAGTAALSHQGVTNPAVMARMEAMSDSAKALEIIGGMAKGARTFDATIAVQAKSDLRAAALKTPALFEPRETDPKSEALPVIWDEFPNFRDLSRASVAAIDALDTASPDGLRAGLRPIGQSCAACHERYRLEK